MPKGMPSKRYTPELKKAIEEDLPAKVQRLRGENEYLKNLQASVLEGELCQRRKRRQSKY